MIFKRNYVVLVKTTNEGWIQFTAVYASSKAKALDEATATGSYTEGTFRVVTARAWGKEMIRE